MNTENKLHYDTRHFKLKSFECMMRLSFADRNNIVSQMNCPMFQVDYI